eukprot:9498126-Pyramimonas_sp.AAC.1
MDLAEDSVAEVTPSKQKVGRGSRGGRGSRSGRGQGAANPPKAKALASTSHPACSPGHGGDGASDDDCKTVITIGGEGSSRRRETGVGVS